MRSTTEPSAAIESEATRLLPALGVIAAASVAASRDADRHALRLRFSLDRVAELQARIDAVGGVFEPARLEVARSILRTHYRRASAFVASVAAPARTARASAVAAPVTATASAIATDDDRTKLIAA